MGCLPRAADGGLGVVYWGRSTPPRMTSSADGQVLDGSRRATQRANVRVEGRTPVCHRRVREFT